MRRSDYEIVAIDTRENTITIRDLNLGRMSVTNDIENVVAELEDAGKLPAGRRLFYYDSDMNLDEVLVDGSQFVRFAPA